jgi:hypothetical protein
MDIWIVYGLGMGIWIVYGYMDSVWIYGLGIVVCLG